MSRCIGTINTEVAIAENLSGNMRLWIELVDAVWMRYRVLCEGTGTGVLVYTDKYSGKMVRMTIDARHHSVGYVTKVVG